MWYAVDAVLIIFVGIGLAIISDALLGEEEGLNVLDDMATFTEGGITTMMKIWKSTMGEIHTTFYNIFVETLKASPALGKLVAATLTAAASLTLIDVFTGQMKKLDKTCVADFFTAINTPINFLKAELYNFYAPLGYLADIFLIPFEVVVAFISLIAVAVWDFLKKTGLGSLICGSDPTSPCCKNL